MLVSLALARLDLDTAHVSSPLQMMVHLSCIQLPVDKCVRTNCELM